MRTDLTSPATDVAAGTGAVLAISKPSSAPKIQEQKTHAPTRATQERPIQSRPAQESAQPAASSVRVAISIDEDRNTIYRFLDQRTGVLIRQIPPEEVLRVMRNINEMLQASEQKVKVDA